MSLGYSPANSAQRQSPWGLLSVSWSILTLLPHFPLISHRYTIVAMRYCKQTSTWVGTKPKSHRNLVFQSGIIFNHKYWPSSEYGIGLYSGIQRWIRNNILPRGAQNPVERQTHTAITTRLWATVLQCLLLTGGDSRGGTTGSTWGG